MSRANTKRRPSGLITKPLRPATSKEDAVGVEESPPPKENGESLPEGTSPIRFALVFFGVPLLLLVVAGILMSPCN